MTLGLILAIVAGVGLTAALVMTVLRHSWGSRGLTRAPSGSSWVLSLVAIWLWWMALTGALKANAKQQTYQALKALPVVSAQALASRPELQERPVAVQDTAYCAPSTATTPDASTTAAIATKTLYSGEDEVEHDDYDSLETVSYGSDQDVNKFSLGGPDGPVRVDSEALTVLPQDPTEHSRTTTSEYSSVKGGYLDEYQDRQAIPCGAQVVVTGLYVKDAGHLVLTPLPRSLSLLTDRPWKLILDEAAADVHRSSGFAIMWFIPALIAGLVQLLFGLNARAGRG